MYACKICILTRGLRGSDLANLPKTEDELFEHLEKVHGITVAREGETAEQATARVWSEG